MLNKKTMKIISIILLSIMIVMTLSSVVCAKEYIPTANDTTGISGTIQKAGGSIYAIFTAIGATVAVVILVWLGIKYIMASPDGKADIKKQAFGYILGAALVFGASQVVALVIKFSESLIPPAGA